MYKSRKYFFFFAALFLVFSFSMNSLLADENKMDEEMMKAWDDYATPGENHKVLEYFIGEWDYTLGWKMSAKDKPNKSSGTTTGKWVLDGRYIKMHAEGTSMGQPFEGFGLMGYDNATKKYTGLWVDNMSTGMLKSWGYYYPSSKRFVEWGKFFDPILGKQAFRAVTNIKKDNTFTYEMFITGEDGKEFQMMKIKYTRKK